MEHTSSPDTKFKVEKEFSVRLRLSESLPSTQQFLAMIEQARAGVTAEKYFMTCVAPVYGIWCDQGCRKPWP